MRYHENLSRFVSGKTIYTGKTMPRKYNCPWPFFACAVFCAVFASPSVSAYAQTDKALSAGLAPHKALYEIQMAKNKNGSQVVNISGQMMYEWQPSCDAWVSNHKFNLVYEYADSPPMRIVSDYSTFESFDGTSLDFTSQRKRDGRLVEELRGHAEIDPQGKGDSAAVYSIPKNLVFDLPRGTLFPVNHTMNVLKKIREGKKFYNTTIFDGSDEDGPVEVNVFIGNPVDPSRFVKVADGLDSSLLGVGAWKLRLAFSRSRIPKRRPITK